MFPGRHDRSCQERCDCSPDPEEGGDDEVVEDGPEESEGELGQGHQSGLCLE